MKKPNSRRLLYVILVTLYCGGAWCQEDTARLADRSLEDLLKVKIVSVSKTAELLFDAPQSASVGAKEQIRKTECTFIMEALRLAGLSGLVSAV